MKLRLLGLLTSLIWVFPSLIAQDHYGNVNLAIAANINGYWSEQHDQRFSVYQDRPTSYGTFFIQTGAPGANPWDYTFKFIITNWRRPTKQELDSCKKNDKWLEYSGIVEYWVNEDYPTIEAVIRKFGWPSIAQSGTMKHAKRTTKAKIQIAPYNFGDPPTIFNIWFDNVAVGVNFASPNWK